MDSFELNKIAGAILAALLIAVGSGFLTDFIFDDHAPDKPGYVVEVAEKSNENHGATPAATEKKAGEIDLASGDAAKGLKLTKKCKACHTFEEGGKNKVGPKLYGIVGRAVAGIDGFKYSAALKAKGGNWTVEFLDCFLKKPSKCVPKTTMGFVGLKKPKDRADLIAYLKSLGG